MTIGEISNIPAGTVFASRRELYAPGIHRVLRAGIVGSAFIGARLSKDHSLRTLPNASTVSSPELLDIEVGTGQDRRIAAAEMQGARTGDGDLRHEAGMGRDELEIRHVDRLAPAQAARYQRHRLRRAPPRLTAA
jgi:hypothetical protein